MTPYMNTETLGELLAAERKAAMLYVSRYWFVAVLVAFLLGFFTGIAGA